MAKKQGEQDRLKINVSWEDAAGQLLRTPAKTTPPRPKQNRKKKAKPNK